MNSCLIDEISASHRETIDLYLIGHIFRLITQKAAF